MFDTSTLNSHAHQIRRTLRDAYDTVRTHVRRIGKIAGSALERAGSALERYVAAKIERRVKPPIVAALALAGVALTLAIIALVRT